VQIGELGRAPAEIGDRVDRRRPHRRALRAQEIAISKLADLSSPMLLQTCSSGKTIPKAKFEFMRADGQGERVKYFEIELENVLIGSIKPNVEGRRLPDRDVGLKFSKVKWKYTQQKIGGGAGGNTSGGWDLASNKIA
jgi:type VI secretion system secreted protein Hcp